ncbi:PiggyBac transposable element-derived protein 4 [Plakobranchus ocellatus]|uniref:PiggyBac transposable element-derived protein 4 n=1 Tax=Plakobranchus ocellatus TaxID=259542 RepID=A0AAV3YB31_9GAST|nr:PiggyBac transposable element-derived protein 4 [Plakobranchus ocellatus]
MNGCDRMDQNVAYYGVFKRKTKKWWEKIFFWILEVTQMNAYVLYRLTRQEGHKSVSIKMFKDLLIDQLTLKVEEQLIMPAGETSGLPEKKRADHVIPPWLGLLATHTSSNTLRKTGDELYAVSHLVGKGQILSALDVQTIPIFTPRTVS